jgi:septal ring factor EnvC (AmiA/AmiB activator)
MMNRLLIFSGKIMKNIQEIFDKIQEIKKVRKEIGKEYRDALSQSSGYQDAKEELERIRAKKKQFESAVQSEMGSRFEGLEKAKREIADLEQVISDIALTNLMNGENINIKDENNAEYEPSYKITFKKIN